MARAQTLAQKLGVTEGTRIATIAAPADYRALLGPLPDGAELVMRAPNEGAGIVHLFVGTMAELQTQLPRARQAVSPSGAVWVSWQKKSSGIATDVSAPAIRAMALETTDLTDVRMISVNDQWSVLKLVVRKA